MNVEKSRSDGSRAGVPGFTTSVGDGPDDRCRRAERLFRYGIPSPRPGMPDALNQSCVGGRLRLARIFHESCTAKDAICEALPRMPIPHGHSGRDGSRL